MESNLYTGALRGITISFGFGEKSIEEQKAILYKGTVERMIMKYNTNSEEIAMIRNKEKFAKEYSEICFIGSGFLTESLRLRISEEGTEGFISLIYKPIFWHPWEGVEKLAVPEDMEGEKRQLYDLIMSKPKSLV